MKNKNALVQAMMDVEYYPPSELLKMNIDITEAQSFPIEKAATLGVAFRPLTQLVSYARGAGKSGLYYVNTKGKTMFTSKSDGQFIGTLKAADGGVGGGLARMKQIPIDPTMLCMAVAIMTIEKKLDAIHETQKEILAFLELKEEAKLKGNLNALADVLNNYKYNWDNDKYKDHKHMRVKHYIRYMDDMLLFVQDKNTATKCYNKACEVIHSNNLIVNPKSQIIPINNGFNFLGWHFFYSHTGKIIQTIKNATKKRIISNCKRYKTQPNNMKMRTRKQAVLQSYIGYLSQCNTYIFTRKVAQMLC
ncbi:MAG TPA: hypothetical protein PKY53_06940 [Clostridia bacterium]|nr:hypothetical protein [Clostridia bacterium]